MTREPRDHPTGPYRVAIEDRLAFEVSLGGLDLVIGEIGERLDATGAGGLDVDLVVWRAGRVEAVVHCRGGRVADYERYPAPKGTRRRATIGSLMVTILVAAAVLAALRSRAGVASLAFLVMLGLMAAVVGSLLMSIRHVIRFFQDPPD